MHALIFRESTRNRIFKELIWLPYMSSDEGIKIGRVDESKSEGERKQRDVH